MNKNDMLLSSNVALVLKEKKNNIKKPSLLFCLLIILFFFSFIVLVVLIFLYSHQNGEYSTYYKMNQSLLSQISKLNTSSDTISKEINKLNLELQSLENQWSSLNVFNVQLNYKHGVTKNKNIELHNEKSYSDIPKISHIFESVSEIKTVLGFVRQSLKLSSYSPHIIQLYRAGRDGDKGHNFQQVINKKRDVVIIMKMIDGTKFGGYLHIEINKNYDKPKDNNAFLFSLLTNQMYMINTDQTAYWFNDQMFFSFGHSDLFISDECLHNPYSLDYFPKAYGDPNNKEQSAILTNKQIGFKLEELEAYQLDNNIIELDDPSDIYPD